MLPWLNSWLAGFKKRFKIKEYVFYGEAASAEVDTPKAIVQIEELCQLCKQCLSKDIFNMDKSELW
jgi:hypothetical protein